MNAIVWTTLITAVATVSGSLGAVWIKSHYDEREQARHAEQAAADSASSRKREAYEGLAQTARYVHCVALWMRQEFDGLPADSTVRIADRAEVLVHLTQAVALVELDGSKKARRQALTIYHTAMHIGDFFAKRIRDLAAAHNDPEPPEFKNDDAWTRINALSAAIESFNQCVRRELDRKPPDQRSASLDARTAPAARVDALPSRETA